VNKDIKEFLNKLNIPYKSLDLYLRAFTHPSYENETKNKNGNYQRLEFVGDAILEHIITDYIYTTYNNMQEGDMSLLRSNLVRMETLYELSKMIDLEDYILLGNGEDKANGRSKPSLVSDVFEAFIAAIYLDHGFNKAKDFVMGLYNIYVSKKGIKNLLLELKDPKTTLQEYVASESKRTVTYKQVSQSGPSNNPEFIVEVYNEEVLLGRGKGSNKQAAEQAAAKDALNKMVK